MIGTIFLIGLVYSAFVGALIAAGAGAVVVVAFASIFALVQVLAGARLAVRAMGGRTVSAEEEPALHATIERLCQHADLPKPRVAVAEMDLPNAFAAGLTQKGATVCVTRGILGRLEPRELEGVLAHELSHVANRDVAVMTIASFLATVAGLVVRFGLQSGLGGRGRDRNAFAVFAIVMLASIVMYCVSYVLLRALSRYREFAADRGAAVMTGAPSELASALSKLSGTIEAPAKDLRVAESISALMIAPIRARGFSLEGILATHPPTERRIERLMAMQARIDQGLAPVAR